jgi:hypothetical protein
MQYHWQSAEDLMSVCWGPVCCSWAWFTLHISMDVESGSCYTRVDLASGLISAARFGKCAARYTLMVMCAG